MSLHTTLVGYKAWADELMFDALSDLPSESLTEDRPTYFGSILRTMHHVTIVDDIFKHHLLGKEHGYAARITETIPNLADVRSSQTAMNVWLKTYFTELNPQRMDDVVTFRFVEGKKGRMTRAEILLHLIDHATYHRGHVCDMMYQIPRTPPTTDLPVYLREIRALSSAT